MFHTCRGAVRSESAEWCPWCYAVHKLRDCSGNPVDHGGLLVTCQVGWMLILEVVFILEESRH